MKDEIKEILDDLDYAVNRQRGTITLNQKDINLLLDYITNLQEKSNNQAEEINRVYKQREKFMKKYGYLKEEKDKYKNVIDKIKEIPLKHINNAHEELQLILRNSNDLEYKNQCSHDFEIIRNNIEIIYNDILELLEEVE